MTDDNNPEEKPSFFDSADEAKSWPPSEGYEVEESDIPDPIASAPTESFSEPDALDELLAEEEKEVVEETPLLQPQEIAGTDYMDMLMHDFSSFDGKEAHQAESSDEEFLVPINKDLIDDDDEEEEAATQPEQPQEQTIFAQDTDKVKIVDDDEDDDDDDALSDIFTNPEAKEEKVKEAPAPKQAAPSSNDNDFDLDKYVQEKTGVSPKRESDNRDTGFAAVPPPLTDDEDSSGIIFEEPEEESKPFRTYASLDYGDETPTETGEDEAAGGILAGVNRNVLILGGIIILVVFYFIFTNIFNRKYDTSGRQRSARPAKEKRVVVEEKELVPLWEVSAQKSKSDAADRQLVQTIYKSSGRDNPFAMPDSILADLQKAAELELLKKQKPNTYRRLAYRATLVGVLTSNENTIALVNQQEATFDVLEGTSRNKILKLATKSMDKAKKDTQEMVVGSYIGPWVITKIESPDSAFSDAKVHIEYEGDTKILNMGKAEELGIFTEEGEIDSLQEPVGGALDEDDIDDDDL